MSATAAEFSTKHFTWSMLEKGRIENTHLAKAGSYGAIANRVLYRIDLLLSPLPGWCCSILPVKVRFCSLVAGSTMSFLSNIGRSKNTQQLAIMFFNRKLRQHQTGSWNRHALLYLKTFAVARNAISLLSF